jgi:hypothetical protein
MAMLRMRTTPHPMRERVRRRKGVLSRMTPMKMEPMMEPRPVRRETRARVRPLKRKATMAPW